MSSPAGQRPYLLGDLTDGLCCGAEVLTLVAEHYQTGKDWRDRTLDNYLIVPPEALSTLAAHVKCPECEEVIPVQIKVEILDGKDGQEMFTEPDLADLWAHAWMHRKASSSPGGAA